MLARSETEVSPAPVSSPSRRRVAAWLLALATGLACPCVLEGAEGAPSPEASLPGTEPLTMEGDIASELVAGVDRFLLGEIDRSIAGRARRWSPDFGSPERYVASVASNRERLARILGVRDARLPPRALELIAAEPLAAEPLATAATTAVGRSLVGTGAGYQIHAVRWGAFGGVTGEGLLLVPTGRPPVAHVVAIPDADQTPEMLCGLAQGVPAESQFARRLAECGCRVVVPVLIDRSPTFRQISRREFLYRSAFELGRHVIGYEIQKILAVVDALDAERGPEGAAGDAEHRAGDGTAFVGVIGWGEGALLALHAAALDTRVDAVLASGHFGPREDVWREPLYRNVFALLEEFGDAEVAGLIAPRALVVEAARGPEVVVPPGTGGGPGRITTPDIESVRREVVRARERVARLCPAPRIDLVPSGDGRGPPGSDSALRAFLDALGVGGAALGPDGGPPRRLAPLPDAAARQTRQFREIDRHNQELLAESPYVRREFFARLDTSSAERFRETIEPYRRIFAEEVIGELEGDLLPPSPRTREAFDEPARVGLGYTGHEVVLDVLPDVIAHGILLVPAGIARGERRPVVVCQHGLEGRPRDVADPRVDNPAYNRYACRLAEEGFVAFAPQNLTIFGDRFRTLQRKANPLKKTLFSVIVAQHRQIVAWLGSLPFVDPSRIAFYGLSYGGKTAMRVPPLVPGYCLSICSADFNDWVWKNASSRSPYSYVWTGEYEIFEFDLGSTFNYAEMAALIAPRPFMVERGHFDGVAPDEAVAYEFAKVRFLYAARLGLGERARIEWFVGPHSIHGVGTFEFLREHLRWPPRGESASGSH